MNELAIAIIIITIGYMVGMAIYVSRLGNRVSEITLVLRTISKKAAEILHSSETPERDKTLEKVTAGEDLTELDKDNIESAAHPAKNNPNSTQTQQLLASIIDATNFPKKL